MAENRPNILYLMTDQHRGDCLRCDGNDEIHTPHLDRIAREGVRFVHAYSSTPSCTPARSALLTGLSPWHHGMLGYGRVAEHYDFELPQAIRDAGYYTCGIGKMHWHPQRNLHGFHETILDESGRVQSPGFESDYRRWFRENAPGLDPDATGLKWNDHRGRPYALPEELHPTFWTGQQAVDFIARYDRPDPFLLKVSFARPHSPYDPPQRFFDAYTDAAMPQPHIGDWAARYADPGENYSMELWHGRLDPTTVLRARRCYYGSVSFLDEQIGRVLGALERRGWLDNTFIIFFSDHGDMTGDHYLWRKTYAYEASARVPMLIRWPKSMGLDGRRGQVLPQVVELRDVLPTFLDVAGAAVPSQLDGRSLMTLVRDEKAPWRDCLDLEHSRCYHPDHDWHALVDGHWKYVYHARHGEEQLFDLADDPGELHDLAADPGRRATLAEWRARLVEQLAERGEPFVAHGRLLTRDQSVLYSPNFPQA